MIVKLKGLCYGYKILPETTKEEWDNFITKLKKQHKIKCIICNRETAKNFRPTLLGKNIITINNKMLDNVFFINHWF